MIYQFVSNSDAQWLGLMGEEEVIEDPRKSSFFVAL